MFQNRDAEGVFAATTRGRYFSSHKELGSAREVDLHACGGILQSGEKNLLFLHIKKGIGGGGLLLRQRNIGDCVTRSLAALATASNRLGFPQHTPK